MKGITQELCQIRGFVQFVKGVHEWLSYYFEITRLNPPIIVTSEGRRGGRVRRSAARSQHRADTTFHREI